MKSNAELSLIFLVSAAPYKALYEAIHCNQSSYKAPLTRKIRLKSEIRQLYVYTKSFFAVWAWLFIW